MVTATDSPAQADTGLLSWSLPDTLDLAPGETITLVFNVGSKCGFDGGQNNVRFTTHTCFGDTYSFSLPAAGSDTANISDISGVSDILVEKAPATFTITKSIQIKPIPSQSEPVVPICLIRWPSLA